MPKFIWTNFMIDREALVVKEMNPELDNLQTVVVTAVNYIIFTNECFKITIFFCTV